MFRRVWPWLAQNMPGVIFAAGVCWEVFALSDKTSGDTFSVWIRRRFRTDTAVGQGVWRSTKAAFDAWFDPHIATWHMPNPKD